MEPWGALVLNDQAEELDYVTSGKQERKNCAPARKAEVASNVGGCAHAEQATQDTGLWVWHRA